MIKRHILGLLTLLVSIQFMQASTDTTTYQVDVNSSSLEWSLDVHHGSILLKNGTIKIVDNHPIAACVTVKMDSVHDQDITYQLMRKTLQNILRSDVFFNTKKYPEAYFVLDQVKPLPDGSYLVQGDLTITGVSNCIQFIIHIHKQGNMLKVTSRPFRIDRLRWGITSYSQHVATSEKNFVVSDSISFNFTVVANRVMKK